MKVKAYPVKAKELKPGDLFSTAGPIYWENIDSKYSLGEKVYIRTNTPTPSDQAEEDVYYIKVEEG